MFNALRVYVINLLIAVDQLFNVLLSGHPDETLSARAYRMHLKSQPVWGGMANLIDLLFFWERNPGHCERAYKAEAKRWQLPAEFRGSPSRPTETYKAATNMEFWND